MTFDINSISASFIFNFLKEYWDELVLLGYTAVQCVKSVKSIFDGIPSIFLICAPVYFPTLIFLIASIFFNVSRMMFTGYIVGASIMLVLLVNVMNEIKKDEELKKMASNGMFTVILCGALIFG